MVIALVAGKVETKENQEGRAIRVTWDTFLGPKKKKKKVMIFQEFNNILFMLLVYLFDCDFFLSGLTEFKNLYLT